MTQCGPSEASSRQSLAPRSLKQPGLTGFVGVCEPRGMDRHYMMLKKNCLWEVRCISLIAFALRERPARRMGQAKESFDGPKGWGHACLR